MVYLADAVKLFTRKVFPTREGCIVFHKSLSIKDLRFGGVILVSFESRDRPRPGRHDPLGLVCVLTVTPLRISWENRHRGLVPQLANGYSTTSDL